MPESIRLQGTVNFISILTASCLSLFCVHHLSVSPSLRPSLLLFNKSFFLDYILLTTWLSHSPCGQGPPAVCNINIVLSVIINGNWNTVINQVLCVTECFSPPRAKKKVLMSLKPLKPKHRQYPSSTAVSHVTALCDWAENTSVSVYVCLCVISEYDWAAACAPSVRAHAYDLSLFFVSAMQSRREKRSILTSLFPGRLILFFQIRALTGFWYCILMWFRSGLSFFCDGIHNLKSEGMD